MSIFALNIEALIASHDLDVPSEAGAKRAIARKGGRPTASELGVRKERILAAAGDLFLREGFAGASVLEVARRAGVGSRTVYEHYKDKAGLFRAVVCARAARLSGADRPVDCSGALSDILLGLAGHVLEAALNREAVELMRLTIHEQPRFPRLMGKVREAATSRVELTVERTFGELARRGRIPKGDHRESAEVFVDLVIGRRLLEACAQGRQAAIADKDLRTRIALFTRGRFGPGSGLNDAGDGEG